MIRPRHLALLTAVTISACGPLSATPSGGTIVVPPPASPLAEPPALTQRQPNLKHLHALATADGGRHLLVATHVGLASASPGSPPQGLVPGPKGDVLQLAYGGASTFYAGGHNLGVWISRDLGASWSPVSPDVAGLDVHGLAADPRRPTSLYAYAVGKGLLVSTDSGAHWSHRAGFADKNYLTGLTVTGDGTLLAGSPELGILASPDQGAGFIPVRNATGQVYSIASAANTGDVVVVAAQTGLFLTANGGKDWSVGDPNVAITAVAVDAVDNRQMYAGTAEGTLSWSKDGGKTWASY